MTSRPGFGLYVHWPFCQAKCPYCDFNSHVVSGVDQTRWQTALTAEIARVGDETSGRILDSIFFGGGTPSLMRPETVAAVIDAARAAWAFANDIEITLEANPNSVEADRFAGFARAGVNRVSIGVQSLRDADLKALGRLHSAGEAIRALAVARETFPRVSFDLIYARQNQTLADWKLELTEALALNPSHLSLYQLTIEDGTAFGDRFARGRLRGLPDEDLAADLFEMTQELTKAAGLSAYEISNHARSGEESRHNLIYWRSGDWAGVGPGAHGRLTLDGRRIATETYRAPNAWLSAVEDRGRGETLRETISTAEAMEERLMMGLRLREGVPNSAAPEELTNKINTLISDNLLERTSETVRATRQGRPVLNHVLRQLLA